MLQNTVIILIVKNISYSKNVHATIFYQMTKQKLIIDRKTFLDWRFSDSDDYDVLNTIVEEQLGEKNAEKIKKNQKPKILKKDQEKNLPQII